MGSSSSRRNKITLQHRIEYLGWRAITTLLRFIPRRGMIIFADCAGWLLYHVLRVRRRDIDAHLKQALGDEPGYDLSVIGRKSWQNTVLTFFEFIQPDPIGSAGWDDYLVRENFEQYCQPIIQSGKPAIVLTAHIGNWESLGKLAASLGLPMAAVAKAMHNPLVNQSILEGRAQRGLQVIQLKGTMKAIPDALKAGTWVAVLGDQDARRRGIFVQFFNRPASTAPGAAHIASIIGCPILPTFSVRSDDSQRTLKVIFGKPIYPDPTAERDADVHRMTQEHTAALEQVIRLYPADYFWLHRRWKTQPKVKAGVGKR